jgi:hypothetical protein
LRFTTKTKTKKGWKEFCFAAVRLSFWHTHIYIYRSEKKKGKNATAAAAIANRIQYFFSF